MGAAPSAASSGKYGLLGGEQFPLYAAGGYVAEGTDGFELPPLALTSAESDLTTLTPRDESVTTSAERAQNHAGPRAGFFRARMLASKGLEQG